MNEVRFKGGCALLEVEFDNLILKLNLFKKHRPQFFIAVQPSLHLQCPKKEGWCLLSLFLANILVPHISRPLFFLDIHFSISFKLGFLALSSPTPRASLWVSICIYSISSRISLTFHQMGTRNKLAKLYKL